MMPLSNTVRRKTVIAASASSSLFSLISWFLCGRKQSVALRVVIIGVIKNNVWFNPALYCMTRCHIGIQCTEDRARCDK